MAKTRGTQPQSDYFPMGFPLAQLAWERYAIDGLGAPDPAGHWPRVPLARALADRMNALRDFSHPATQPARAGELLGMGLLTEVLRYVADRYCVEAFPGVLNEGLRWTVARLGTDRAERPIPAFVTLFPPQAVREKKSTVDAFLKATSRPLPNRQRAARELLLLRLALANRALKTYRELYDDTDLAQTTPYLPFVDHLERFFESQAAFPETGQTLTAMLRAPMMACPDSLEGQLDYVRRYWHDLLPQELREQLELARAVLKEETMMRGFGPGPLRALEFGHLDELGYEEFEAFSLDKAWMPNLVLIAKTVYVWLDQLSKRYRRSITRLDQIPDEELDRLARWGFSGLWLIGVWERSPASRTIKRAMGNPEAESSAYSIYDYEVAGDLGGQDALENLARRARRRGIRLASDMVPNHMGVYSKWVVEHPHWFIQRSAPPFPGYRFTGMNLSHDSRVGVYIEDGYWNHSDAAVVFKRIDHWTGQECYLYHGNDGTSMPWNDTAQLDFTLAEVREAVIQTILHVARIFPIIRFDAAMTLAKRHYQRLWFPKPDDAGAIPSRAEHRMNRYEFDQVFPNEFWREVVDRVAAEAPDTLLLAEAFWLMEGYFVRTLGMHRVYNSAFMNMLKIEDNAKYRQTVKNVLEFSPEVLQRFVNFMNNPDEDTAEAQFGTGDKYVGIAIMMVTMPGLPMFGHGQIEGLTEKYGMEYRRAYWDEQDNEELIERHEREIFPLMHKRHLFSGAKHFALFDFVTPEGWVDENVFAYSNRSGGERALVLYNNAYAPTRGVVHTSTAINEGSADNVRLRRRPLGEALGLNAADTCYYIVRDQRSRLEYLHYAPDLDGNGLHVELHGYQYYAFVDWREVHDFDHSWGRLHAQLGGRPVPSVEDAYLELNLAPILEPFRRVMNGPMLAALATPTPKRQAMAPFRESMDAFLSAVGARIEQHNNTQPVIAATEEEFARLARFEHLIAQAGYYKETLAYLQAGLPKKKAFPLEFWRVPLAWSMVRRIGTMAVPAPGRPNSNGFDVTGTSAAWLKEWFLVKQIARAFEELDGDAWRADLDARLVRICVAHGRHLLALQTEPWGPILDVLLKDPDIRTFLQFNHFGGKLWLHKDQLERMLYTIFLTLVAERLPEGKAAADPLMLCLEDIESLAGAAEDAHYEVQWFVDSLK